MQMEYDLWCVQMQMEYDLWCVHRQFSVWQGLIFDDLQNKYIIHFS